MANIEAFKSAATGRGALIATNQSGQLKRIGKIPLFGKLTVWRQGSGDKHLEQNKRVTAEFKAALVERFGEQFVREFDTRLRQDTRPLTAKRVRKIIKAGELSVKTQLVNLVRAHPGLMPNSKQTLEKFVLENEVSVKGFPDQLLRPLPAAKELLDVLSGGAPINTNRLMDRLNEFRRDFESSFSHKVASFDGGADELADDLSNTLVLAGKMLGFDEHSWRQVFNALSDDSVLLMRAGLNQASDNALYEDDNARSQQTARLNQFLDFATDVAMKQAKLGPEEVIRLNNKSSGVQDAFNFETLDADAAASLSKIGLPPTSTHLQAWSQTLGDTDAKAHVDIAISLLSGTPSVVEDNDIDAATCLSFMTRLVEVRANILALTASDLAEAPEALRAGLLSNIDRSLKELGHAVIARAGDLHGADGIAQLSAIDRQLGAVLAQKSDLAVWPPLVALADAVLSEIEQLGMAMLSDDARDLVQAPMAQLHETAKQIGRLSPDDVLTFIRSSLSFRETLVANHDQQFPPQWQQGVLERLDRWIATAGNRLMTMGHRAEVDANATLTHLENLRNNLPTELGHASTAAGGALLRQLSFVLNNEIAARRNPNFSQQDQVGDLDGVHQGTIWSAQRNLIQRAQMLAEVDAEDIAIVFARVVTPELQQAQSERAALLLARHANQREHPDFQTVRGEQARQRIDQLRMGTSSTVAGESGGGELEGGRALAIANWNQARDYARTVVDSKRLPSLDDMQEINRLLNQGLPSNEGVAGEFRRTEITAGHGNRYPSPQVVPYLMADFHAWLIDQAGQLEPMELAAQAARRMISIHPFADGNGRTCRMVADMLLERAGYPAAAYETLDEASHSDFANPKTGTTGVSPDQVVEKMMRAVERSVSIYEQALS